MHSRRKVLRYNLWVSNNNQTEERAGDRELAEIDAGTQVAFAEGAEFAGLFVQVVGSSVLAIAILVAFYAYQRSRSRKI